MCYVVEGFCVQLLAHYCGRLEKSMFCVMYTSNLMSYPYILVLIALQAKLNIVDHQQSSSFCDMLFSCTL